MDNPNSIHVKLFFDGSTSGNEVAMSVCSKRLGLAERFKRFKRSDHLDIDDKLLVGATGKAARQTIRDVIQTGRAAADG